MLVTDRRLAVATTDDRFALDVPLRRLRRGQFDIERARPATLFWSRSLLWIGRKS